MQSVWMNVMGVSLTIYRQLWALEGWDKTLTRVRQCRLCFRFINGNRSGTCVRTVLENPLLIELHWLPVAARIKFKPLMIAYRVIAGYAPTYLNALVRANVTSTTRAGASLSTFMKLLKTQLFREHLPY